MLGKNEAVATVAVRDLAAARRFYQDTLGLEVTGTENDEVVAFKAGSSQLFVYRSDFAGTNKATSVTWTLSGNEVDSQVKALKAKGVRFERYDMPGMKMEGDVHVAGDMRVAWFKDPDGNIHSLVSG